MTSIDRTSALAKLTPGVADKIHGDWKANFKATKGDTEPRFKPIKPKFADWVVSNTNLESLVTAGLVKLEIDIAHVDNSQLDPGNAGENTAAAEGALTATIEAVLSGKNLDDAAVLELLSSTIHDQWMGRNSWAAKDAPHQMVPFAQLSSDDQEKDRVIARHAIAAVKELVASEVKV